MPNFTVKKKDGGMTCIERKTLAEAEKFAKSVGGKVVHKGNDHGDDENHPNIVRDKARAKGKSNDEEE